MLLVLVTVLPWGQGEVRRLGSLPRDSVKLFTVLLLVLSSSEEISVEIIQHYCTTQHSTGLSTCLPNACPTHKDPIDKFVFMDEQLPYYSAGIVCSNSTSKFCRFV